MGWRSQRTTYASQRRRQMTSFSADNAMTQRENLALSHTEVFLVVFHLFPFAARSLSVEKRDTSK